MDFTLFRLRDDIDEFDDFVRIQEGQTPSVQYGPIAGPAFRAKLYVSNSVPNPPIWAPLLETGFPASAPWPLSATSSALLLLRVEQDNAGHYFAFAFGQRGRYLLRDGSYHRRYGLRTALNLIADPNTPPKLRAFETARHSQNILRARLQATAASSIEVFELDLLRDIVRHATGVPVDVERWGKRVGGSDALRIAADLSWADLGKFCLAVDAVASGTDYRQQFGWIDYMNQVSDKQLVETLEDHVVELLRTGQTGLVRLAPPEIVDWDLIVRFQYHFDTRSDVRRYDISLDSYLAGLKHNDPQLVGLSADKLRSRHIIGLNADGSRVNEWSVWRCLAAEFEHDGATYVLDDGSFYNVDSDYLDRLNSTIIPYARSNPFLPPSPSGVTEPKYNQSAAANSDNFLLLDADEIHYGGPGGVELCDILTSSRQLVHVKRYSGSATLSHLFAQARNSAELLLTNRDFRTAARDHIRDLPNSDPRFDFINAENIQTSEFEVVLAIIKKWGDAGIDTLPFFAKVSLRRALMDLTSWGYIVSVERVPVGDAD